MTPGISFGNLGFGEIALVLGAVWMLFGCATCFALQRRGELDAELQRRHYFAWWMLGGLLLGMTTTGWTQAINVSLYGLVTFMAGALLLVTAVHVRSARSVGHSLNAIGLAILAIGCGIGSDIAMSYLL